MAEKPSMFLREATGLVREVGFLLGMMIIITHVVGLGWQKRAFQFSGPWPIPNDLMPGGLPAIFWAFLVGGIIVWITGYAAGLVTAAMPRSGGGYVTISRVVHPFLGYLASWLMFLSEAFSYGLIGVAVFEAIMIFYNIALAPTVIAFNALQLFLGGLIVIWIFAILALFGVRQYGRLLHVMFWIPAAITIGFFAMWITRIVDPSSLARGVETVMGASPEKFVQLALQSGMAKNIADFGTAFSWALAGAFWAYMGWYSVTFIAGEVKEANRKLPAIVLSAGVLITIIYLLASSLASWACMGVATTTAEGHTWSFFQAYSWLTYGPEAAKEAAKTIPGFQPAWTTGVASLVARGLNMGWLSWLIALAGVLWLANDIPPFLLVASRAFFAMAFDRMLPESFAYVSERWHSPIWAIIVTAVLGSFGCIAESNVGGLLTYFYWAGMLGTDVYDAFFLTLFCLSLMLLPIRRKDIYDRAAVKPPSGATVALGVVATILAAYCLYTFGRLFVSDAWSLWQEGVYSALGGFIALIIIGIALYFYYKWKNKRRGIDMTTIYLSIPPE